MQLPVPYSPDVERIDAGEAETTAEDDGTMAEIREKTFQDGGHAIRSVHAKSQGVFQAVLTVAAGCPSHLRSVYSQNPPATTQ